HGVQLVERSQEVRAQPLTGEVVFEPRQIFLRLGAIGGLHRGRDQALFLLAGGFLPGLVGICQLGQPIVLGAPERGLALEPLLFGRLRQAVGLGGLGGGGLLGLAALGLRLLPFGFCLLHAPLFLGALSGCFALGLEPLGLGGGLGALLLHGAL